MIARSDKQMFIFMDRDQTPIMKDENQESLWLPKMAHSDIV